LSHRVFTVLVGGKAGEGIKKAAQVIGKIAVANNYNVFQTDDYQSLIKGGHNFSLVSLGKDPIYCTYKKANIVISFDKRSVSQHKQDIAPNGLHFCDDTDSHGTECVGLPLLRLMKEHYGNQGNMSLASVAIFCAVLGIPLKIMKDTIKKEFRRYVPENMAFAEAVYSSVKEKDISYLLEFELTNSCSSELYTGNQMIALGAWVAGMDCYFSYPMTPASSILHYLALKQSDLGVTTVHAESELAAANMAIGACFAGKRAAVGSSGGGIALMQEAFSLAGMVEAPLLFILSSRPGPATGVSTYTAQEDLYFALNQGHGEFPRIVASPDCLERAFSLTAELMQLAWASQSPAILLTEKHLSESMANVKIPDLSLQEYTFQEQEDREYWRYRINQSGVSALKFPGSDNCSEDDVIKWNSNEHLESGVRTDDPECIINMKEKRMRKSDTIYKLSKANKRVEIFGSGNILVFAYGSTALELREALKYYNFTLIVPIYLDPFPKEELALYRECEAIVVEHSSKPNFARFLKEQLELKVKANILRYDGRHFSPEELITAIKEAEDA
jgi:2-oxoglutarate ferredoxin oxidoreductase subunit alpha